MEKRVFLNMDRCCGCGSCAAACSYGHLDQTYLLHSDVKGQSWLPLHCKHCEQPTCVSACPNGAMKKSEEDKVVRRNIFACVGCGSCAVACPFGVIDSELNRHIVAKCDLCSDWHKEGKAPRCVSTCTAKALTHEEVDEAVEDKSKVLISDRLASNHPAIRRR
ncbi:4Fe-4S dicluster domain-containing protein [Candidatus Margulisiibacteriota bacterium]